MREAKGERDRGSEGRSWQKRMCGTAAENDLLGGGVLVGNERACLLRLLWVVLQDSRPARTRLAGSFRSTHRPSPAPSASIRGSSNRAAAQSATALLNGISAQESPKPALTPHACSSFSCSGFGGRAACIAQAGDQEGCANRRDLEPALYPPDSFPSLSIHLP